MIYLISYMQCCISYANDLGRQFCIIVCRLGNEKLLAFLRSLNCYFLATKETEYNGGRFGCFTAGDVKRSRSIDLLYVYGRQCTQAHAAPVCVLN